MDTPCYQFYNVNPKSIGEIVLFTCFDCNRSIKRAYKEYIVAEFSRYYSGFTLKKNNSSISVITVGPGASRVGDAVLSLKSSACQAVLYTGAAGGIGENISIGDIFVARQAIIGEGFSNYYRKIDFHQPFTNYSSSSIQLVNIFNAYRNKISHNGKKFHMGNIFTIESLFAETTIFLQQLEYNNVQAIDMETSAFYTAAQVAGLQSLAVHYISDLPQLDNDSNIFNSKCRKSYIQLPLLIMRFITSELLSEWS